MKSPISNTCLTNPPIVQTGTRHGAFVQSIDGPATNKFVLTMSMHRMHRHCRPEQDHTPRLHKKDGKTPKEK
jgi:hypothetical protein